MLHFFSVDGKGSDFLQRFLINTDVKPTDIVPVTVVLNWGAELKKN